MTDIIHKIINLKPSTLGCLLYLCMPYRRQIVHANIDQVFGNSLTYAQKQHLAKAFYSHIVTSIKELIAIRFTNLQKLKACVEVRGHQILLDIATQKRGVLILTGHIGNWELAPLGGILNFKQFQGQFHFIRRTLKNKLLEHILFGRYTKLGLKIINKSNSLNKVCAALEQGHAVIFVLDQHAAISNRDGIAVEFFGKKAGTYRSLASIAGYTGVPVVPALTYRRSNGSHVLEFREAIYWQDYGKMQTSLYHNTLAYNKALEQMILSHPEQWNWLHKRWKL